MSTIENNNDKNEYEKIHLNEENERNIYGSVSIFVLLLTTIEALFGCSCNSLALLADSCRLFADFLMYFKVSTTSTKKQKIIETLVLGIGIFLLIVLAAAFIFLSIQRLSLSDVPIKSTQMLVGAFIAMLSNIGICIIHATDILEPRKYTLITDFISVRIQQTCHVLINHGLGFIVFFSALLIYISDYFIFMDSIAAIVMSILLLSNIVAIVNKYIIRTTKKYSYDEI
uniref:DUF1275 domain-containing protein n=1 Tax=Parastrongyloides trichosuri TaxID=131310 RepID=A0A0N4ZJS1_PARTI